MKRIGVLTSGGDAPGMNAAVRAVVRMATSNGLSVLGFEHGYRGLMDNQAVDLDARAVGGIIQRGGTILGTARSKEFQDPAGRERARETLRSRGVEGLVVVGGEGSLRGALALYQEGFPVVGVPATIDNDVGGTDMAIGVDTALNTALEAIDRIKDTASAHNRAFVVEVMGRHSGYLALTVAMASGAEMVLIPEVDASPEMLITELHRAYARGKPHFIVIAAEGAKWPGMDIYNYLTQTPDGLSFEVRLTVLGHVQRGGSPSASDRLLASRLGAAAVEELIAGRYGRMVGLSGKEIISTELDVVLRGPRYLDMRQFQLAGLLAR
ncbi:MAG: 6-phosphofructokinase [Chloroflexota bacterium]